MEGLTQINKCKPSLEARLASGIYSQPAVEMAAYTLFRDSLIQYNALMEQAHVDTRGAINKVVRDEQTDLAIDIYERIKAGTLDISKMSRQEFLKAIQPKINEPVSPEALVDITDQWSVAENSLEEENLGYILVLGYDSTNKKHMSRMAKEQTENVEGQILADLAPEKLISGNIIDRATRNQLLKLMKRDGAALFTKSGDFIDGRQMFKTNDITLVPTLTDRFPDLPNIPELRYLTPRGLDPRVGARNKTAITNSYLNPDFIIYTLSTTHEFTIRRYQKGAITFSTQPYEDAVAKLLISKYSEKFANPQQI